MAVRKHEQADAIAFDRVKTVQTTDGPAARAAAAPAPPPTKAAPVESRPAIAVIVMHGMGSQVPFETLDTVASRLADITETREGRRVDLKARAITVGEDRLSRLELDIDQKKRTVHMYEVYWAPLTEGKIGIRDVIEFLVRAGWNSVWSAGKQFTRLMFGRPMKFNIQAGTRGYLALALGVVLGLVGLNAAAIAVHGLRAAGKLDGWIKIFSSDLTAALFAIAAAALVFVVLLLICIAVWTWKRRGAAESLALPRWLTAITWFAFFVATLGVVVISGWLLVAGAIHWLGWNHWWHAGGAFARGWALTLAYGLVLVVSWFVKGFLVQYAGDVAAYVFSHRLDRFDETRSAIKTRAARTAKAVYEMVAHGRYVYDRVVFVGHSLGSVVAYDTLNRMLSDDDAAGGPGRVLARTKMLMTFGSPLDKTAYLFRLQGGNDRYAREALAATVQPLIEQSKFRPGTLEWVNVYAHNGADLIGSRLDYYDDVLVPPIENISDADASVPIAAHNQHWKTNAVWTRLYDRLLVC